MIAPLAEVVSQTPRSIVTKVSDAQVHQASFFDIRLVLLGNAFMAFRSHMDMVSEQAARHCLQMDRLWWQEITQKQRDLEAICYAEKFILMNMLIGLGGLGQIVAVVRVLWSLMLLVIKYKLGRA